MPVTYADHLNLGLPTMAQSNPWLPAIAQFSQMAQQGADTQAQLIKNQTLGPTLQQQLEQMQLDNQKTRDLMPYVVPSAQANLELAKNQADFYPDVVRAKLQSAQNAGMTEEQKLINLYNSTQPGTLAHALYASRLNQLNAGKSGISVTGSDGTTMSIGGTPSTGGGLFPSGLPQQPDQSTSSLVPGTAGRGQRGMMIKTTNPDGSTTWTMSPTMSTETGIQTRRQAETESNVIGPPAIEGSAPYQSLTGGIELANDIANISKNPELRQKILNYAVAKRLQLELAANQARQANPSGKVGVEAINSMRHQMFPNLPGAWAETLIPRDIQRDAGLLSMDLLRKGVDASTQQVVTGMPYTEPGSPSSVNNSQLISNSSPFKTINIDQINDYAKRNGLSTSQVINQLKEKGVK